MKLLGTSANPTWYVIAAAIMALGGLETVSDPRVYHDHWAVFYIFGADLILLTIIAARAWMQSRNNRLISARLEDAIRERLKLAERISALEATSRERNIRMVHFSHVADVLRDRTIILRDCDEDHERRLQRIEERFRLSHDQAVARVALRGHAFDDVLTPEGAETK